MTLVVSWVGTDNHGTSSAYIASDSRISWNKKEKFDFARKVFAFNNSPDILGYCGDVLFPSIVVSQIIEMDNCGLLFKKNQDSRKKSQIIEHKLKESFKNYPHEVKSITNETLSIIYISRENSDNKKFFCCLFNWNREKGWTRKEKRVPNKSDILFILGSGKSEFDEKYKKYQDEGNTNTSRNVFHCFCDTLFNIKDNACGGAPQLVGIYRKPDSVAQRFGIIRDNKRYLFGAKVDNLSNFSNIEWRNEFFEVCDGETKLKFKNAQSQPNSLLKF